MQTVVLEVEETLLPELIEFVGQHPGNRISIKNDVYAQELDRRLQAIDEGKTKLIPLAVGMQTLREKLQKA